MRWSRVFFSTTWFFLAIVLIWGIRFHLAGGTEIFAVESEPLAITQEEAEVIDGEKAAPIRVVLLFVGDMMLGRHVETLMIRNGAEYPFENISAFLARPDFTHVNLEGPIVYSHSRTPDNSTSFSFSEDKADVLVANGIDAVSLGNNHTLDRGSVGYENTKEILTSRGVLFSGHSTAMGKEYQLAHTVQDLPIRFLSFNVTFPFNDKLATVETVRSIAESTADLVIVNVHWGSEYQLSSNIYQQDLAHQFIDAGADVVIGHHPHVAQEVEMYNGHLIFYSLGNFVFDQYFSKNVQEGLAVSVAIEGDEMRFRLHPLESASSQPRLMDQEDLKAWLQALADRSSQELTSEILSQTIKVSW